MKHNTDSTEHPKTNTGYFMSNGQTKDLHATGYKSKGKKRIGKNWMSLLWTPRHLPHIFTAALCREDGISAVLVGHRQQ